MEAIVLVGGLGTRLREVIPNLPKPMAPVNGRPFLEYLLEFWIRQGIDHVVMATGYKHEVIQNHFGKCYGSLSIDYSIEETLLGTGGAIFKSMEMLRENNPFFVLNGDTYFPIDTAKFMKFHQMRKSDMTLVLRTMPEAKRYGSVSIAEDGKILEFRPPGHGIPPFMINAGTYLCNKDFLEEVQQNRNRPNPVSLESDLFPSWISDKKSFYGWPTSGDFIDIGIPEDYRKCQDMFRTIKDINSIRETR